MPAIVGFVIVLAERRIMGFMQARLGPNRVGPQGVLQGLADLVKLVTKEDITPAKAEKAVHFLAPVLAVIPALTALAVIPFGPPVRIGKTMIPLWVADINIGLLFLLAITSIGVYGIILGGWSSNNKYSLLGGLRSAAQLVSYEVPMGLALVSVLLMSRSLSLVEIVRRQEATHLWFFFPGMVAFFIYFVAGVAETNRNPFDLPEAESELVSGFNTEYSGVKFAFFFLGEYTVDDHHLLRRRDGLLRRMAAALPERPRARFPGSGPRSGLVPPEGRRASSSRTSGSARPSRGTASISSWRWAGSGSSRSRSRTSCVVAFAILLFPGRTTGMVWLSWIFGGLFVLMYPAREAPPEAREARPSRGRAADGGRLERRGRGAEEVARQADAARSLRRTLA